MLSSEVLVGDQPSGDLRTFFLATFRDAEAVETAFRDAGGSIIVRATAGDVPVVAFSTNEAGRPCLSVSASEGSVVELRLAIPHSITH
jgi:hypothetical protein